MSDVDFYADVICERSALGAQVGDFPSVFEARLGGGFLEDRKKKRMRYDYGLLEVFFERFSGSWVCTGFTVQVHRLGKVTGGLVPESIEDFGPFHSKVKLTYVRSAVESRGGVLTQDQQGYFGEDFFGYLVDDRVSIIATASPDSSDEVARSNIWSISVN